MLFGSKFLGLYWRDEHNFFQKNISSFVLIMEVKHDVWHVQNVHIILILIKPYLCHVLKLLYLLHFSTYLFRLFLLVTSLQDECQIERKVASIIFVEYNKLNISSRCIINKVFKTSVYSQFCQACGCGVCVFVLYMCFSHMIYCISHGASTTTFPGALPLTSVFNLPVCQVPHTLNYSQSLDSQLACSSCNALTVSKDRKTN